jgi:hypothetical protein
MNTHLNPIEMILGGVGITSVNTFLFLSELNSTSITFFHLFQSECFLHSSMVFQCGSLRILPTMTVETHELTEISLVPHLMPHDFSMRVSGFFDVLTSFI